MNHPLLTDEVLNDPQRVAAYVFQFRQLAPDKAVVIVESSRDALVLFEALNELNITLLPVRGKPKCIEVVENTTASGINGCIALVDADFDRTQWRNLPDVPIVLFHLVSSKMVCRCIFGLAKSVGLMQNDVILDSETLRRWFRSQIRPQDLQNSLMWQELVAWLTIEGLSVDRKRP